MKLFREKHYLQPLPSFEKDLKLWQQWPSGSFHQSIFGSVSGLPKRSCMCIYTFSF